MTQLVRIRMKDVIQNVASLSLQEILDDEEYLKGLDKFFQEKGISFLDLYEIRKRTFLMGIHENQKIDRLIIKEYLAMSEEEKTNNPRKNLLYYLVDLINKKYQE